MIKKLNKAGDTIIEVMIALAIMGSTLAGAYYLSNYSLNTILEAHFRSDALFIAQSQLEQLKSQVNSNPSYIISNKNLSNISQLSKIIPPSLHIYINSIYTICNPSLGYSNNYYRCQQYLRSIPNPQNRASILSLEPVIFSILQDKTYNNSFCMINSNIIWGQNNCYFDTSGDPTLSTNYPNFVVSITGLDQYWNQIKVDVSWQGRTSKVTNHVDLYYGFNNSP